VSVLALVAAGIVAGCGGSHKASTGETISTSATTLSEGSTQTTATMHHLAQTYLRIVAPANRAAEAYSKEAESWNGINPTKEKIDAATKPVIVSFEKADNALLRVQWPPAIRGDIKVLVNADGAVVGDLQSLSRQNATSIGQWATQYSKDSAQAVAAVNVVRSDLGLPPAKP
jgi:hypothetical protein